MARRADSVRGGGQGKPGGMQSQGPMSGKREEGGGSLGQGLQVMSSPPSGGKLVRLAYLGPGGYPPRYAQVFFF